MPSQVGLPGVRPDEAISNKARGLQELGSAERLALRQGARRQRLDLKAAAVRAEMLFHKNHARVTRSYVDPVTGQVSKVDGPTSRVKCMRVRYAPTVSFVRHGGPGSPVGVVGVTRCANRWACPACMYAMLREKGEELRDTVTSWHAAGPGRVFLLTLTARHHAWTEEPALRDAIQESWREVWQGHEAQAFKVSSGLAGWCRRLEVNYGANGAHPHQHAVLAFELPKSEAEQADIVAWFYERWSAALGRRGFDCDRAHGAHMTPCDRDGQYLVKMGLGLALELTASNQKEAAEGSRTPLQVLADYAAHGAEDDGRLWQQHVDTWAGRRMLEWSRGRLAWRATKSAPELSLSAPPAVVATLSAAEFDAVPMRDRLTDRLKLQEAAESSDWQQTAAEWAEQQLWRLGLVGVDIDPGTGEVRRLPGTDARHGLPDTPLDRPRRQPELRATTTYVVPEGDSWRPPGWWWRELRPEEIAERVEAEGLNW